MSILTAKRGWFLFFFLGAALVIWFSAQFTIRIYPYLSLSSQTSGIVENFFVQDAQKDKFGVVAKYRYYVGGKEFIAEKLFTTPIFLNRYAAESHIEKHWKDKNWTVWYSAKHPEKSSLQRLFPFKTFFNLCLSLGVVLYFFGLKSYVSRRS